MPKPEEESLEERLEVIPEEIDAQQKAKDAAEAYLQLKKEDDEEMVQKLAELGVISNNQKDRYLSDIVLFKKIGRSWIRGGRLQGVYEKIKEEVIQYIGKTLSKSDETNYLVRLAVYAAIGEQFLNNYEQSQQPETTPKFDSLKKLYIDVGEAVKLGLSPQKKGEDNKRKFRNAYDKAMARFVGKDADLEKVSAMVSISRGALEGFIEDYQKDPLKVDFEEMQKAVTHAMSPILNYAIAVGRELNLQVPKEVIEANLAKEVIKKLKQNAKPT